MQKVKTYDNYKNSGIEWIGEIPQNWHRVRLRFLCNIQTGDKDTVNRVIDGEYPFYVRSPIIERINTYTFDGEAILTAGDGVGAGKVFHYVNGKFDYHQRVYNLHNFNKICSKYLYHYLKENFIKEIEQSNAKSTVDSIRLPMLLDFPVVFPTYSEQQQIADYLDKKCVEIDRVVEIQKDIIEKLKEYKQSVITEAVTKGLDKSTPLKDSGIEWIGKIPEHWECQKLKQLISKPLQYGANESGEEYNENFPRYIRITDIKIEDNLLKDSDKLSLKPEKAKNYILEDNDILFARSGATVGKTFLYKKLYGISAFAGYLIRANVKKSINAKYIYYYTLSNSYDEWKKRIFIQATIQNIGANKYNNLEIALPEIKEQDLIVEYLDKKCSEIDSAISDKEKLIEKLTEYKKSLIYECVTGKRKVVV